MAVLRIFLAGSILSGNVCLESLFFFLNILHHVKKDVLNATNSVGTAPFVSFKNCHEVLHVKVFINFI